MNPLGGAWTSNVGAFWQKMYAKTKEFGSVGGVHPARPLGPPMCRIQITI